MKRLMEPHQFLVLLFLGIIGGVPLLQVVVEARRGEAPQVSELFRRPPTAAHLRAFERDLEEASWAMKPLRPWVQWAQFAGLQEAGEKALVGRDGWLFYRPGVDYLVSRPELSPSTAATNDPVTAIVSFRDDLAARGIRLVVLPAPNKESVYPNRLTRRAAGLSGVIAPQTQDLITRLKAADVEVLNLFGLFAEARQTERTGSNAPLYLAQDTHWSPAGVALAAHAIAQRILKRGWVKPGGVEYEGKLVPVRRIGDVLHMLQAPPIEARATPETVSCVQVLRRDNGQPYKDRPDADVLFLGDSFLRIYEQDEPGAAGLVAHVARELKQPLTSLVSDGGASTLVRQELHRRPGLLKNKKVVIWEFVERDLRFGAEGWQRVPLPAL
jgi:hypothetical protein